MKMEIFYTIIASFGGLGVILAGLITWLANVAKSNIIESIKASNAKDLAELKSKLDFERETSLRNSNAQFEIYSELWNHLQDVKSIADRLWKNASSSNLNDFISVLSDARRAVNRGRLILNESHYNRLINAFDEFENYQIGKAHLIELRNPEHVEEVSLTFAEYEIREQIQNNRNSKEAFERLLDEILILFKAQLSIEP